MRAVMNTARRMPRAMAQAVTITPSRTLACEVSAISATRAAII
jgi:hypothetical protein